MKRNIGSTDKLIRVVISFGIGVLHVLKIIDDLTATLFLSIAVYLAVSALLNFSIFYYIFGLKTTE